MRAGRIGRLGAALALGRGVLGVRRNWRSLPPERRARAQELVRRGRGLSPAERRELAGLARDLDLGSVARGVAASAMLSRRRRRGY